MKITRNCKPVSFNDIPVGSIFEIVRAGGSGVYMKAKMATEGDGAWNAVLINGGVICYVDPNHECVVYEAELILS